MLVIFTHVFKVFMELLVIMIMFSFGYCAPVERLAGRIISKITRYVLSRTLNVTGLSLTLDWVLPLFFCAVSVFSARPICSYLFAVNRFVIYCYFSY